jgi:acyl-CoA dehydrogenase
LFTDEHDMFRAAARSFVRNDMAPNCDAWERDGIVDKALFRSVGDLGLFGIGVDQQFGGGGGIADFRFNVIFMEEVCRAGVMSAGLGIQTQADVIVPYLPKYGTDEQQGAWLPKLCTGEWVAAIAMTEPSTGSDLAAIGTRATRSGDHFVLSGSKTYISNAINADLVIVVCRTGDDESPQRSISLLVVEAAMEGFKRGRNLDKVGQHAADTGELFFDDVVVPASNLLGEENRGFFQLMLMLPQERLSIAATALAQAETAFGWTLDYCKERRAFGQPIGSFQHSRFVLAEMRTELDMARVFVDRQIEALAAGELTAEEAAQSKWMCTDLNTRVLDQCLQLHGGFGYMEESAIGRAWRDGRAMRIYGGTNEIMKDIVGRRMLGV